MRNNLLIFSCKTVIPEVDKHCLGDLVLTDPRDDKLRIEQSKGGLLRESFSWVLTHPTYQQWQKNEESTLLWIRGDAGKGKTMLMLGTIDELAKENPVSQRADGLPLLSYFFCQGSDSRLNNATAVLRGLLYLLAVQQPSLLRHLRSKYESMGRRLFEGPDAVYSLMEVLLTIFRESGIPEALLVIDAVDECENNLPQLLDFITQLMKLGRKVKWIISSRNRDDIERHLGKQEMLKSLRLELNPSQISHAIENFIDTRVSEMTALRNHTEIRGKVKERLRLKSDGTFLWAALVITELRQDVFAADMLESIDETPVGLIPLFDQMMRRIHQLHPKNARRCVQLLAAATSVYRPLHLLEMRITSGLPQEIMDLVDLDRMVCMCGSFLTVRDNYVYFIHQSAKDYLSANLSNAPFDMAIEEIHYQIYSRSLRAMSDTLRQDICQLKDPGPIATKSRLKSTALISIEYACLHWFDHLCQHDSNMENSVFEDGGEVHTYFAEHLLHWLESLGHLREISTGIFIIKSILKQVQSKSNSEFAKLLQDSLRLVLAYGSTIELAPLQVYCGALIFCPENTEIKRLFWKSRLPVVKSIKGVPADWTLSRQVLECHGTSKILDTCFSPDDEMIVTAGEDSTIKIWDASTGMLKQALEGHGGPVNTVCFLQDSCSLVSGSEDGRVLLWNTVSATYEEIFKSSEGMVSATAFSSTTGTLVVGLSSGTVLLRAPSTSTWKQIFEGTTNFAEASKVSPDNVNIALGFANGCVRLWNGNSKTWKLLQADEPMLKGHRGEVNPMALSPNGRILAAGSQVCYFYNSATNNRIMFLDRRGYINKFVWSPDSEKVCLVPRDDDIFDFSLWDVSTGALVKTFHGTERRHPLKLIYSTRGDSLVLTFSNNTMEIWDSASLVRKRILRGHKDIITDVTFAPDDQMMASISEEPALRLWDAGSGACKYVIKSDKRIKRFKWAPDLKTMAFTLEDGKVHLWDVVSRTLKHIIDGNADRAGRVWFSSNGKLLAVINKSHSLSCWNIESGSCESIYEGEPCDKTWFSAANGKHPRFGDKLIELSSDTIGLKPLTGIHKMSFRHDWIFCGSQKVIWLPPEYRIASFEAYNSTLALGHSSPRVTFLELDLESSMLGIPE
ncbi:WD40 repeat-like protein [Aspergillus steynii IBT 23096]|uniref:WD40 repeat-like protein n=1 Tax=Aspergillus steynii IBT 23096 TaxID=1392250 RepID=A0A2I2GA04_9EURO|nr:WD40 repeat-like protein [Aspergillus steynii IBT 23096]PLB49711.1 WD40 repeat-like protein [Aspergillus steynii IBT 23096]